MERLQLKEAVVVEGRYDKNVLSQIVDTLILETRGFGIFKDREQMALLRQVAKTRGLIVLTDSDGAGFVIRNRLIGSIPKEHLKHAYIPDVYGKEKRKIQPGKEGKLGVEGMSATTLRQILEEVGTRDSSPKSEITNGDFFAWGLTGEGSQSRRALLLKTLELPEHMSKNGLLQLVQGCYSREMLEDLMSTLGDETKGAEEHG